MDDIRLIELGSQRKVNFFWGVVVVKCILNT